MSGGQLIASGIESKTAIVWVALATLPAASVAVQTRKIMLLEDASSPVIRTSSIRLLPVPATIPPPA